MAKIERNPRSEDSLDFSDDNRTSTVGTKNDVKKRIPLGRNRNVLQAADFVDDEDWHYAFINEENLWDYKRASYTFVMADGSSIDDYDNVPMESVWRKQTGYDRQNGRPLYSYLMKLPMSLYKEDRANMKRERNELLSSINRDYLENDDTYGNVRIDKE